MTMTPEEGDDDLMTSLPPIMSRMTPGSTESNWSDPGVSLEHDSSHTSNSTSSGPTKLPVIKVNLSPRQKRDRGLLVKSPSCPTLWQDYDTDKDTNANRLSDSLHAKSQKKKGLRLPEILDSARCTPSLSLSPRSSGFFTQVSKTKYDLGLAECKAGSIQRQSSTPAVLLLPIKDSDTKKRRKKASKIQKPGNNDNTNSGNNGYQSHETNSPDTSNTVPQQLLHKEQLDATGQRNIAHKEKCREWLEDVEKSRRSKEK